jgi:hypothetical protein
MSEGWAREACERAVRSTLLGGASRPDDGDDEGAVREGVHATARGTNRFAILASWFVILASVIFVALLILTKLP